MSFRLIRCNEPGCNLVHSVSVVPALRSGRRDSNGARAVGDVADALSGAPEYGDSTPLTRGDGLDTRLFPRAAARSSVRATGQHSLRSAGSGRAQHPGAATARRPLPGALTGSEVSGT